MELFERKEEKEKGLEIRKGSKKRETLVVAFDKMKELRNESERNRKRQWEKKDGSEKNSPTTSFVLNVVGAADSSLDFLFQLLWSSEGNRDWLSRGDKRW